MLRWTSAAVAQISVLLGRQIELAMIRREETCWIK
jgi:hypothetical protein